jgi:hypothetical protein
LAQFQKSYSIVNKKERKRRKRERERELWAPGFSALNPNGHVSDNIINVLLYFYILVLCYRKLERFEA